MVKRKLSGSSAVELVAGIIVLVPVLFLLLDVGVCILAVMTNDNLCRDAARAAAAGRPRGFTPSLAAGSGGGPAQVIQPCLEDSKERAQGVLDRNKTGGYIGTPTLVFGTSPSGTDLTGPIPDPPVVPSSPGGFAWQGSYSVTTQVIVTLPASIPNVIPPTFAFQSQHVFPMTKVEAPLPF